MAFISCLAACATPTPRAAAGPAAALETITIDAGHIGAVCVGFCTSFRLTARSAEHFEAVRRPIYRGGDKPGPLQSWRGRRGDFAQMRATLAPIRPAGVRHDGPPCLPVECNPDRPYRYILRWDGPAGSAELHSNAIGYSEIFCRIHRAMADLGFSQLRGRDDKGRGGPLHSPCDAVLAAAG